MYKLAKPFFIKTITPLHAGSGQDLGIVDMPIQRERHTGFPKIEGSGLKGAIREVFESKAESIDARVKIHLAFGYDNSEKNKDVNDKLPEKKEYSGALGFTDARILLFPVKSAKGIFAWITCPTVLKKLNKDLKICNPEKSDAFNFGEIKEPAKSSCFSFSDTVKFGNNIILEEYSFESETTELEINEELAKLTGLEEVKEKLVILRDNDFNDFVNLSTEVITRTKIDNNTGTVQAGALFTEEYLPSETVMYSLALTTPIFQKEDKDKGNFKKEGDITEEQKVMTFFEKTIPSVIQIGGNATIGKGLVEIITSKEGGK